MNNSPSFEGFLREAPSWPINEKVFSTLLRNSRRANAEFAVYCYIFTHGENAQIMGKDFTSVEFNIPEMTNFTGYKRTRLYEAVKNLFTWGALRKMTLEDANGSTNYLTITGEIDIKAVETFRKKGCGCGSKSARADSNPPERTGIRERGLESASADWNPPRSIVQTTLAIPQNSKDVNDLQKSPKGNPYVKKLKKPPSNIEDIIYYTFPMYNIRDITYFDSIQLLDLFNTQDLFNSETINSIDIIDNYTFESINNQGIYINTIPTIDSINTIETIKTSPDRVPEGKRKKGYHAEDYVDINIEKTQQEHRKIIQFYLKNIFMRRNINWYIPRSNIPKYYKLAKNLIDFMGGIEPALEYVEWYILADRFKKQGWSLDLMLSTPVQNQYKALPVRETGKGISKKLFDEDFDPSTYTGGIII